MTAAVLAGPDQVKIYPPKGDFEHHRAGKEWLESDLHGDIDVEMFAAQVRAREQQGTWVHLQKQHRQEGDVKMSRCEPKHPTLKEEAEEEENKVEGGEEDMEKDEQQEEQVEEKQEKQEEEKQEEKQEQEEQLPNREEEKKQRKKQEERKQGKKQEEKKQGKKQEEKKQRHMHEEKGQPALWVGEGGVPLQKGGVAACLDACPEILNVTIPCLGDQAKSAALQSVIERHAGE
jgi:hypothetical protein